MRLSPLLLLSTVVLIGCSASAKYDIDVSCKRDWLTANTGETTAVYGCTSPYFQIQCNAKTVQSFEGKRLCTTHDDKTVRIIIIDSLPSK
jgi:hypothetical protein